MRGIARPVAVIVAVMLALPLALSTASAQEDPMPSGMYEDPQGRFTLPLVGDWTQVETDGPVGQFTLADPPLELYVGALESDDLEAGVSAALEFIGIDTPALSLANTVPLPPWTAYFYSLGDGRGVTVAGQERDGTTYALIMTGDEAVTSAPPPQVMETIAGFAFVESGPQDGPLAYEDPQGRFSFPLTGNWTQIETDGSFARFALADPPLDMHIVAVESDDLEAGLDAALEQIGVDRAALTSTLAGESLGPQGSRASEPPVAGSNPAWPQVPTRPPSGGRSQASEVVHDCRGVVCDPGARQHLGAASPDVNPHYASIVWVRR